jgi:TPP-dependent pyruvate/acetoin dehydrogenase alpha subunit
VDGNDLFAMHEVLSFARAQAMEGKGPFLIEARTFRMGAHTTSDDPSLQNQGRRGTLGCQRPSKAVEELH